jgi:hypothetical protein
MILNERKEYWKLNEKAIDNTLWKTCFGKGFGHVVIQTTE